MRVIIVRSSSQDPERSALEQLLDEAGIGCEAFPANEIPANVLAAPDETVGEDETEAPTASDNLVLVVVLSEAVDSDDELGKAVMRCAGSGARVVGVWLAGARETTTPKCIEDYGFAVVHWNTADVRRAVIGQEAEWQNPQGARRPTPYLKRNVCK